MTDLTDQAGGTGIRAASLAFFGGEISQLISQSRWMLLAVALCVLADFRYGRGESRKRFERARAKGDKVVMAQYKWRTSRAVRRTVNKLVDYLVWLCVGAAAGKALLSPAGIDPLWGGTAACAVAIACEAKSFIGHFFYLHGFRMEGKGVTAFFRSFAVSLAKRKDKDVGAAIEDGFKEMDGDSPKT